MAFTRIRVWLRSFVKAESRREGREHVRRVRPMLEELESRLAPATGTSSTLALADAPLLADDALVDLLDPALNAANGVKTSLHPMGLSASNGINFNPPNYAGVGQGPGGASTTFAAGGGNSSGVGGGGPIGGNLAALGNQGLFSNPAVTAAAAQSAAVQPTLRSHAAPAAATAASIASSQAIPTNGSDGMTAGGTSHVLTSSDDPIGNGTISGSFGGSIRTIQGGSQLIQLGGSGLNISGGLIGSLTLTGTANYNGGSGGISEGGGGGIGTTTDNETGFGVNGPLSYSVSGSTISGKVFFNGTTSDGSGRIVSGEGTFSGTIDGNGNINGALNANINLAPPPLVVTQATDDGSGNAQGTLSWAITQANANPGSTIEFKIAGGGSQQGITISNGLPAIIKPTFIDGYSQTGAYGQGPAVGLDGATNAVGGNGLEVDSGGVTIEGLAIFGFGGNGIAINNATGQPGNWVFGCNLGMYLDGNTDIANGLDGIRITGPANTIGGSFDSNVISGNRGDGVDITGSAAVRNVVDNNFIGTDGILGSLARPNSMAGVDIDISSSSNSIGLANGDGNLISGNGNSGIHLNNSSNNLIANDWVGVAFDGKTPLPNGTNNTAGDNNGITLDNGSSNNTIGAGAVGGGRNGSNVISGNTNDGIFLNGTSVTKNVIGGNAIGVGSDGATKAANGGLGIELQGAFSNLIGIGTINGGGTSTNGNVISGNGASGIALGTILSGASQNLIAGNIIGLDVTGEVKVGNSGDGIYIGTGDNNNTIGSGDVRNVISGNAQHGIYINGAKSTLITQNFIGTDANGNVAIGNGFSGIRLDSSAQNNTIGAVMSQPSNLISGNGTRHTDPDDAGIQFTGGATNNNLIVGNYIGTDFNGLRPETGTIGNYGDGIDIETSPTGNGIGSAADGSGNLISDNGGANTGNGYGISATNTLIQNNTVGLDINGDNLPNKAGWLDGGGNTLLNNTHQ